MKRTSMMCLILLAGLAVSLMAVAPANLLSNGGFESSPNGATGGWGLVLNGGDSVKATFTIDSISNKAYEGTNFARVSVAKVSTQNWHVLLKDPSWTAKKGFVYNFSIWARADTARPAEISVWGDSASIYTYRISSPITLTKEWQQFNQVFTSDAAGAGKINFALACGSSIGVYDFDAAVITESEPNAGNIYQNGSFESGGGGWSLWVKNTDSATGAADMTFPTTGAKSGTKFCRVNVTSKPKEAYEIQLQDGTWKCKKNFKYTFTVWAKADSERTIALEAIAGSSRNYAGLASLTYLLTPEWQECSVSYTSLDLEGNDSISFVIPCGGSTGQYGFDSITLVGELDSSLIDTTSRVRMTGGNLKKSTWQYAFQLTPDQLRCTMNTEMVAPFKVDIVSVQGRLFSSKTIRTAGRVFSLPRPPSGTWVVRVNSDRSGVVTIP
jgi:hypothetical protein